MKNYPKILQEEITKVQSKMDSEQAAHDSKLGEIRDHQDARIKEFEDALGLRTQERTTRMKEEIHLRESLALINSTNQQYLPRFIKHLLEWEAHFNTLRETLAKSDTSQPPAPFE